MAWADDERALLVAYYCPMHLLRGWGIVDDRRKTTADRVARYPSPVLGTNHLELLRFVPKSGLRY